MLQRREFSSSPEIDYLRQYACIIDEKVENRARVFTMKPKQTALDHFILANMLRYSTTTHSAASIINWCPHWQDSALIHLPIFKRNQVRHRENSPSSSGTA